MSYGHRENTALHVVMCLSKIQGWLFFVYVVVYNQLAFKTRSQLCRGRIMLSMDKLLSSG